MALIFSISATELRCNLPVAVIPFTTGVVRFFVLTLVMLVGCGDDPAVIVPDVMSIIGVFPTFGSTEVPTNVQPYVYFSYPVADPTDASSRLSIACVGAPPCAAPTTSACTSSPAVQTTISTDRYSARLAPSSALASNMCYVVVIGEGIAADGDNVGSLPTELRSQFQTQ